MFKRFCTLVAATMFWSTSQAYTYMPMTDAALEAQTPVIVLGQVQQVALPETTNRPATEYAVQIIEVVKGEVPASSITVRTPGSARPSSSAHYVPGLPSFEEDQIVLLFLRPRNDGTYGIMQLGLGAFNLIHDADGEPVFARDLAGTQRLPVAVPLANAANELPRRAADFLAGLGAQTSDVEHQLANSEDRQAANFTLLTDRPGGTPSRWFEFDQGQSVPFLAHNSGQPGMTGGGFTRFQNAIAAWNNDAGSNIRYQYAGTTTASVGFTANDGLNVILFDDPNVGGSTDPEGDGEVDGSFDCRDGGVLAAGGFVSDGPSRNYNGTQFLTIVEADIITNDGAGCFFGGLNGTLGEQIFAHELGHTLGLGHSCGDVGVILIGDDCDVDNLVGSDTINALMRAYPHLDDRGADLRADDRAGAAFLYAASTEPGGDGGNDSGDSDPTSSGDAEPAPRKRKSSGGGGCSTGTPTAVDPLLWLLSAFSLAWLLRRRLVNARA